MQQLPAVPAARSLLVERELLDVSPERELLELSPERELLELFPQFLVRSCFPTKNAPFYSLITILTYFSTYLYTTRFIKQHSLSGSIGVCAVRVGVLFIVTERWCFVHYGGAVAAETYNKTNHGRTKNKTVGAYCHSRCLVY